MKADLYFAGWDGGETGTTLVCINAEGKQLLREKTEPLPMDENPADDVIKSVKTAFSYMETLPGGLQACGGLCISSAGVGSAAIQDFFGKALHDNGCAGKYRFTAHYETALYGALNGQSGIILISGTGALCFGIGDGGQSHRCGGLAHLFDDEGSGYAIGRDVLAAVLRASDGRENPTSLTDLVFSTLGVSSVPELITRINAPDMKKADITALALLCFIAQIKKDAAAISILLKAADDLYHLAKTTADTMNVTYPKIALTGGMLSKGTPLRVNLEKRLHQHFDIVEPETDAAHGAAILARDLFFNH